MITKRHWEIDFIRGLAVILMVFYHGAFDIHNYGFVLLGQHYDLKPIVGGFLPDLIGSLFLLMVGVSSYLRSSVLKEKQFFPIPKKNFQILFSAFLISLLSSIYTPESPIYFGVLHCIGVCALILPFFVSFKYINLVLGLLSVFLGYLIQSIQVSSQAFMALGFIPKNALYGDYYPLFPWFGVALLGVFIAHLAYPFSSQDKVIKPLKLKHPPGSGLLEFLGRHSLFIYLIHQPLLFALFYFIGWMKRSL